jgi:hypothetical protein
MTTTTGRVTIESDLRAARTTVGVALKQFSRSVDRSRSSGTHRPNAGNGYRLTLIYTSDYQRSDARITLDSRTPVNGDRPQKRGVAVSGAGAAGVRILSGDESAAVPFAEQ